MAIKKAKVPKINHGLWQNECKYYVNEIHMNSIHAKIFRTNAKYDNRYHLILGHRPITYFQSIELINFDIDRKPEMYICFKFLIKILRRNFFSCLFFFKNL